MRNPYSVLMIVETDSVIYTVRETDRPWVVVGVIMKIGYIEKLPDKLPKGDREARAKIKIIRGWHVAGHEYVIFKSPEAALDALYDYSLGERLRSQVLPKLQHNDAELEFTRGLKIKLLSDEARSVHKGARKMRVRLMDELDHANELDGKTFH